MPDSLDVFRYIGYLRLRWRLVAVSCAVAVALAVAASLFMTRQYTATARVVIQPPAGSDPRASIAVSPIYLESLKTYEQLAASDSLFQKALDQYHLRGQWGARAIESVKKRVLKVGLVHNTRILEIACTLPDAREAQQLAQFLAQSTVDLNQSLGAADDRNLAVAVEQQARDVRARVDEVEAAWTKLLANEPVDDLQAAVDTSATARSNLQQQILSAQLETVEAPEPEKSNARARLDQMHQQLQAMDRQIAERGKLLAERMAHRDNLEAERKTAQAALAAAEGRLREARSESGFRGERLAIIDPGIVPERPSSPNPPLNVAAALLLGLLLPLVYLAIEMNFQEQRAGMRRSVFHALAKTRDE